MPTVQCPIEGCEYATPDVEPVVAAALITTHATSHRTPSADGESREAERIISWHDRRLAVLQVKMERLCKGNQVGRYRQDHPTIGMLRHQLRKDLTRNAGGTLTGMTEDEVFTAMRGLAIREENTMVARVALHNMKQDRDEPIRAFGAR